MPSMECFFPQLKQTRPSGVVAFSQMGQTCSRFRGILLKHFSQIHSSGFPQDRQEMGKRVSKMNFFVLVSIAAQFLISNF